MVEDTPQHPPPRAQALRTRHYFTPHTLLEESEEDAKPARDKRKQALLPASVTISVRGCTLEFTTGAGVFSKGELDAGSRLLIETVEFSPDARLCDLGCGWGVVGCFAAKLAPDAQVWMCDINLNAARLTGRNIWNNQLSRATVWCGDGLSAISAPCFDAVFCNPPVRAGNAIIAKLFGDAWQCLLAGGVLWIVLRTAQGAKSWQHRLAEQFGNCETVAIKGGYRILKSVKL